MLNDQLLFFSSQNKVDIVRFGLISVIKGLSNIIICDQTRAVALCNYSKNERWVQIKKKLLIQSGAVCLSARKQQSIWTTQRIPIHTSMSDFFIFLFYYHLLSLTASMTCGMTVNKMKTEPCAHNSKEVWRFSYPVWFRAVPEKSLSIHEKNFCRESRPMISQRTARASPLAPSQSLCRQHVRSPTVSEI